jgi:hypothetical protein
VATAGRYSGRRAGRLLQPARPVQALDTPRSARQPSMHARLLPRNACPPEELARQPPNRYLRRATDKELADYYQRRGGADTPEAERAHEQVFAELQRRDIRDRQREATEERRRSRWSARKADRSAVIENEWLAAEAQTRGVMLNRRGREAGIEPRSLFTGPEARARKYASEELLNYWEYNPRPTEAFFQGEDTRTGYGRMLAPRRRITSEEQAWRDRYDRIEWEIQQTVA